MEQRKLNFTYPPVARRNDPISSHMAETEITRSGIRGRQSIEIFALVCKYPESSCRELAEHSETMDYHQIQKRLSDLKNDGYIGSTYKICPIAKRKVQSWFKI